jgi:hypothetical protein
MDQPSSMPTVLLIPPLTSPDHPIEASAPDLYVATAPHGATLEDRRHVAALLEDGDGVRPAGSSWVVLPPRWTAMGGVQVPPPPELAAKVAAARPDGWSLVLLVDG